MTMRLGLRSREPLPKRKASIDVPIAICRFCKQVLSDGEPGPSGVYEGCCPTCGEIQHKRQQQARAQMERAIEKRRARGFPLKPGDDPFMGMRGEKQMDEKGGALAVVEGQMVDKQTGEILPETAAEDFRGYAGVATVTLDQEQAKKLAAILPDEAHDILPTGEVYVSQVHYRRLLNEVFGPGGWALVPRGPYSKQGNTICREYALVGPGGRFISEAIGEADYQPNNPRMSYASACEAAKSNALTRCCKDIGIASECWDRRWCETFKASHCVQVWREGEKRPQWRRKDAPKWYDEKGEVKERNGAERAQTEAPQTPEAGPPKVCPKKGCGGTEFGTANDGAIFCRKCGRPI